MELKANLVVRVMGSHKHYPVWLLPKSFSGSSLSCSRDKESCITGRCGRYFKCGIMTKNIIHSLLSYSAMLQHDLATGIITDWYCIKTNDHRIMWFSQSGSPGTPIAFSRPTLILSLGHSTVTNNPIRSHLALMCCRKTPPRNNPT